MAREGTQRRQGGRSRSYESWDDVEEDGDEESNGPSASTVIRQSSAPTVSCHPSISNDFHELMKSIGACEKPRPGPIGRAAEYRDVEDYMGQYFALTLAKFDDLQDLIDLARQESMPIMVQRSHSGRDRDWLWVDTMALIELTTSVPSVTKEEAEADRQKLQSRAIMYGNINVTLKLVKALLQLSSQPSERISLFAIANAMQLNGGRMLVHLLVKKLVELGMSLSIDERTDTLSVARVKDVTRKSTLHATFQQFFHSHNSVRVAIGKLVYDLDRDPEPYLLAFSDNPGQVISTAVQMQVPTELQDTHLIWKGDPMDVSVYGHGLS